MLFNPSGSFTIYFCFKSVLKIQDRINHYFLISSLYIIKRGRRRPKKTIRETIRKNLEVNELDSNFVYDKTL